MSHTKIDASLQEIGFIKSYESKYITGYTRYNKQFNYYHNVDLGHKRSGAHIVQSYDRDTNECVGLTFYELTLFQMKMEELGLCSGKLPLLQNLGIDTSDFNYEQIKRVADIFFNRLCTRVGKVNGEADSCKSCPYGDAPTLTSNGFVGCYEAYMKDIFSAVGLEFKE